MKVGGAAIAFFAKAPIPGRVKTRMVPPLTPDAAARIARGCLEISLRRFVPAVAAPFTLFLDGIADSALLDLAGALGVPIVPQARGDLGERLRAAYRVLREGGAGKTIAIGSDSPTLDPRWISDAIAALDTHDLVIGPCEDGGYYLIGSRDDVPEVFNEIPWSTADVTARTLERARALGLSVHELPVWYDVDDIPSLARAMADAGRDSGLAAGLSVLST